MNATVDDDAGEPRAAAVPRCLNCATAAPGAFCPACGQETRTRLPTLREFMREAAGRLVAVDGKLWRTLGALVFRPGFLSREYLAGRRRRYIRPARLFLVTSLLLFASLRIITEITGADIVLFDRSKPAKAEAGASGPPEPKSEGPRVGFELDDDDSIKLSVTDWAGTMSPLKKRVEHFNALPRSEKYAQITAGMFRYGPYAMFALLPASALLLKLVYLGRRKRHPYRPRLYGEHIVFAAHDHAFAALAIIACALAPNGVATAAVIVWLGVYLLMSLRAVYGGSWLGVLVRSFVMFIVYSVLFGFATAGLVVAAIVLG
jgi:hypothetical protein